MCVMCVCICVPCLILTLPPRILFPHTQQPSFPDLNSLLIRVRRERCLKMARVDESSDKALIHSSWADVASTCSACKPVDCNQMQLTGLCTLTTTNHRPSYTNPHKPKHKAQGQCQHACVSMGNFAAKKTYCFNGRCYTCMFTSRVWFRLQKNNTMVM